MVAAFDVDVSLDSGHVCALCSKEIDILEEVACLEVVYPSIQSGMLEYLVVPDEVGDYAFDPYFFCLNCWEEEMENLLCTARELEPPVEDARGIVECAGCTSDILPWETSGVIHLGDFRRPERDPDGDSKPTFVPYDMVPKPFCVSCLAVTNGDILEMWEGGITHMGACEDGVHARCWRYECCEEPGKIGCRLFNTAD